MEEEPELGLTIGKEEFTMNRTNSSLFTFAGELALFNHVFLVQEAQEDRTIGTYVWNHNPFYKKLSAFIVEHSFPMHLNMLAVGECDKDAFDETIRREAYDLDNIPEGW